MKNIKQGDTVKFYIGGMKQENMAHYGYVKQADSGFPNYDKDFAIVNGLGDPVSKDELHKVDKVVLKPLSSIPLSTQLSKLTGYGWTSSDWKSKDGGKASSDKGSTIVNVHNGLEVQLSEEKGEELLMEKGGEIIVMTDLQKSILIQILFNWKYSFEYWVENDDVLLKDSVVLFFQSISGIKDSEFKVVSLDLSEERKTDVIVEFDMFIDHLINNIKNNNQLSDKEVHDISFMIYYHSNIPKKLLGSNIINKSKLPFPEYNGSNFSFEKGGEIKAKSDIEKLQLVIDSNLVSESIKELAKSKIKDLKADAEKKKEVPATKKEVKKEEPSALAQEIEMKLAFFKELSEDADPALQAEIDVQVDFLKELLIEITPLTSEEPKKNEDGFPMITMSKSGKKKGVISKNGNAGFIAQFVQIDKLNQREQVLGTKEYKGLKSAQNWIKKQIKESDKAFEAKSKSEGGTSGKIKVGDIVQRISGGAATYKVVDINGDKFNGLDTSSALSWNDLPLHDFKIVDDIERFNALRNLKNAPPKGAELDKRLENLTSKYPYVIEWHEGKNEYALTGYDSLSELQKVLKKIGVTDNPKNTYNKVMMHIEGLGRQRIDLSEVEGDFDPNKDIIGQYIGELKKFYKVK